VVAQPDLTGRKGILRVHARGKPMGPDVDLDMIADTSETVIGTTTQKVTGRFFRNLKDVSDSETEQQEDKGDEKGAEEEEPPDSSSSSDEEDLEEMSEEASLLKVKKESSG